ncbi:hypothetical protein EJ06DRAFT_585909 [Trichodelitschia bisporula]|uniref:Uncharacterized protein n=1 Tax=Trichodelitschia bisporula TaxID=703511 RepID=A0A6G1HHE3_9PEZI|nr:hypothetical protein EJ06DRAFT_585909 [Trichodelitschia bisporula]
MLLFRGVGDMMTGLDSGIFDNVTTHLSGLHLAYFSPQDYNPFTDGVKFILPRWVRLGNEPEPRGVHDNLFDMGFNPSMDAHPTQLYHVLEHWTMLVQAGVWEVGEDGVEGGIEKFKEADTEERCEWYVIEQYWQ